MMSSPPNGHNIPTSGGGGGSVTGSLHDHHGALLMQQQQQQQQQLDYYQNPNAIYNQIQQSHYGNTTGPGGAADHLLTTQQYLQSLHIADMPQLMTDGSGKAMENDRQLLLLVFFLFITSTLNRLNI